MNGKFVVASGNEYTVRAIDIALKQANYSVIIAQDGLEAVDLALDRLPNAVFLGLELGGMEGLDAARALRALDPTEHVPIIFLAENADEAKKIRAARLPLTECLTPPYDLVDVQARAAAALRTGQRIVELREHATETPLLAITDPLTRLYNRRYLLHRLAYESARSVRYKVPLGVLLVDVDNLGEINAKYGVLQGDAVLIEVGQLLKTITRAADVVGRADTQDFMILAPHTEEVGARVMAERIVKTISEHHFVAGKLNLPVTVSVGLACALGSDLTENLALVGRAEGALDRAKQGGKNRVEMG
jgi:two-component system cell cycle response regulator